MVCLNSNSVLVACIISLIQLILLVESEKSLGLCKLPAGEFNPKDFAQMGEKGETGVAGEQGPKGIKGETGDSQKGSKGDIGANGTSGLQGTRGERGIKGIKGMQGDKGKRGVPGSMGRPGLQGTNGTCPCPELQKIKQAIANNSLIELHEEVCKNVQSIGTENDVIRVIDSVKIHIPVLCITRDGLTTLTCIPPKTIIPQTFTNISKGFWLSSKGVTLQDIYNLNHDYIQWFLKKSNSVFQTIRYHCYNSVPFSPTNVDKSLLLLGWNEKIIGPVPTLKNPNFYSVPFETDFCSKTKDEWSYTDIIIVSGNNQRLPIIDFYIRDTNNEVNQTFKIEHLKLCFD